MNKNHTNESNYTKLVMPRQLVLPLDYGILIKETAPVRLLDAVLEELDYKELQHLYSPKGRKSKVPPHILFKIFVYAMSNGVYSTRMIQQQCEENINYMWLLQGYSAPSHMTFQRFFARCTLDILMNLFSQMMEAINRRDTLTFNEVFIDGTKLEANANKYTFVWRKAVQKRLDTLPSKLAILKQDIWNELGLDTHCMNDECIYTFLAKEIEVQHMELVQGKGKHKTPLQRLYERAEVLYEKRKEYEQQLYIMGERNSYSKTDHDATFMRILKYALTRNAKNKTGFISERKVYVCESCNRCGYKKECQRYMKPTTVNPVKRIEITPAYDAVLAENQDRLLSDTGIQLRINRSIQVEGAFGVLKQDLGFRRFLHRGSGKVHKMLYLLAMGFNIEKLHNRIQAGRVNTTLFTAKETA